MIKIENVDIYGWETAIRGMRNPMNSWDKSDSEFTPWDSTDFKIGSADFALMSKLCNTGSDHRKFMRMITVYLDITAPLYWWKEFDTYKVGTVANSCSTMHRIAAKEFTLDDFSHEHLIEYPIPDIFQTKSPLDVLYSIVDMLNICREKYLETKDKTYWWQLIQLLPSSYNQCRTIQLNYEVLANIYKSRKHHKLDEWLGFCAWIETLPYSELITGGESE